MSTAWPVRMTRGCVLYCKYAERKWLLLRILFSEVVWSVLVCQPASRVLNTGRGKRACCFCHLFHLNYKKQIPTHMWSSRQYKGSKPKSRVGLSWVQFGSKETISCQCPLPQLWGQHSFAAELQRLWFFYILYTSDGFLRLHLITGYAVSWFCVRFQGGLILLSPNQTMTLHGLAPLTFHVSPHGKIWGLWRRKRSSLPTTIWSSSSLQTLQEILVADSHCAPTLVPPLLQRMPFSFCWGWLSMLHSFP